MGVLCIVTWYVAICHKKTIQNFLSTAQLSISQKALGAFPEDGNLTPKQGATIHNKPNELVYLLVFHLDFYWGF
jgi:hypothetical protein